MENTMILLFSPADTDLLTALAANRQMPAGVPSIQALQLNDYQDPEASRPLGVSGVVFDYLTRGGIPNFVNLAGFLATVCCGTDINPAPPQDLPWEGLYHPAMPAGENPEAWLAARHHPDAPTVGVLFYRAQWMSGDLAFVDALIQALESRGCNVIPAFSFTLRDDVTDADGLPPVVRHYLLDAA